MDRVILLNFPNPILGQPTKNPQVEDASESSTFYFVLYIWIDKSIHLHDLALQVMVPAYHTSYFCSIHAPPKLSSNAKHHVVAVSMQSSKDGSRYRGLFANFFMHILG